MNNDLLKQIARTWGKSFYDDIIVDWQQFDSDLANMILREAATLNEPERYKYTQAKTQASRAPFCFRNNSLDTILSTPEKDLILQSAKDAGISHYQIVRAIEIIEDKLDKQKYWETFKRYPVAESVEFIARNPVAGSLRLATFFAIILLQGN